MIKTKVRRLKIKGKVTPYTPQHARRYVDFDEFPEDIRIVMLATTSLDRGWVKITQHIVNNRLCDISVYFGARGVALSKTITNYVLVSPTDEPAPPRKQRVSDTMAFNAYIQFCKTKNWQGLFYAWRGSSRYEFRKKLYELLDKYDGNSKCDNCTYRFKCFTEK